VAAPEGQLCAISTVVGSLVLYIGQMFDKTSDEINNWGWDNPHGVGDEVDRANHQTTSPVKV
jgi:hypothetical protein